jgi:hypothetical protein
VQVLSTELHFYIIVSVPELTVQVNALVAGMDSVKAEIQYLRQSRAVPSGDRFSYVMQVCVDPLPSCPRVSSAVSHSLPSIKSA